VCARRKWQPRATLQWEASAGWRIVSPFWRVRRPLIGAGCLLLAATLNPGTPTIACTQLKKAPSRAPPNSPLWFVADRGYCTQSTGPTSISRAQLLRPRSQPFDLSSPCRPPVILVPCRSTAAASPFQHAVHLAGPLTDVETGSWPWHLHPKCTGNNK
jgi:hypothetical protein